MALVCENCDREFKYEKSYLKHCNAETCKKTKQTKKTKQRPTCKYCKTTKGITLAPDNYSVEIEGDRTPYWICKECRDIRAQEI